MLLGSVKIVMILQRGASVNACHKKTTAKTGNKNYNSPIIRPQECVGNSEATFSFTSQSNDCELAGKNNKLES